MINVLSVALLGVLSIGVDAAQVAGPGPAKPADDDQFVKIDFKDVTSDAVRKVVDDWVARPKGSTALVELGKRGITIDAATTAYEIKDGKQTLKIGYRSDKPLSPQDEIDVKQALDEVFGQHLIVGTDPFTKLVLGANGKVELNSASSKSDGTSVATPTPMPTPQTEIFASTQLVTMLPASLPTLANTEEIPQVLAVAGSPAPSVTTTEVVEKSPVPAVIRVSASAPVHEANDVPATVRLPQDEKVGLDSFGRGYSSYWDGRTFEALAYFDAAVARWDSDARIWYFKALAELSLGRSIEAEASVARGVACVRHPRLGVALERVQGPNRAWLDTAISRSRPRPQVIVSARR